VKILSENMNNMDYDIDIEDNKNYIYVISYYTPSNDLRSHLMNTDISIFEMNEWDNLLNKSEKFKQWVNILNNGSDYEYINTPTEVRSAVYYLYHNCEYCKYNDFTSLEYYNGNKEDICERVFLESKNKDRYNISINNFREWISVNLEKINKNYNIIKIYEDV
jgi:hypothetical protein